MTTSTKLSATQTDILKVAAYRPNGNIEPLPTSLRGGARTKVIDGLLSRDLIEKFYTPGSIEYYLTDAGYAAVGRKRPQSEAEAHDASAPRTRNNSKQAQVINLLKRPEGATIPQIMEATGWQSHTVRGTFAGAFKKKLGLAIVSQKEVDGERVYRIS